MRSSFGTVREAGKYDPSRYRRMHGGANGTLCRTARDSGSFASRLLARLKLPEQVVRVKKRVPRT